MLQVNPYLRFSGKCKEAMEFYRDALGAELTSQTVGESQAAAHMPPETHNGIMHSEIKINGTTLLMGSDMMDEKDLVIGNAISISLNCSSDEEIKSCFEKLSAGGQIYSPLKTEFWGGTFGQLKDKYGNEWMLNFQKEAYDMNKKAA